MVRQPTRSTLTDTPFPHTTLCRSLGAVLDAFQPAVPEPPGNRVEVHARLRPGEMRVLVNPRPEDRLGLGTETLHRFERSVAVAVGPAGKDQRRREIGRAHV